MSKTINIFVDSVKNINYLVKEIESLLVIELKFIQDTN